MAKKRKPAARSRTSGRTRRVTKPTRSTAKPPREQQAESYRHPTAESLLRPEVGTQAQFRKKKPPVAYRYDSSLSPALDWDGQNPAREQGEALIAEITAQTAALRAAESDADRQKALETIEAASQRLKALSKPFLNWAGKAERLSFDVPTLPLFVHERLSTKAIIETLKGHKKDQQLDMFDLFGDPRHSVADQVLKAYEYSDKWVNRMILGDSLVVMNSLLHYENLSGQVQMIYMDPPYGVQFGSNFQPFIRRRDVKHNDDDDMTREPEMVQAYRDTWELGLHSYLTYLRDRLFVCRELLTPRGSMFVQIGDENLHHVREVMDEVFGPENFCAVISIKKTSGLSQKLLPSTQDFLLWYAKDKNVFAFTKLYRSKMEDAERDSHYSEDDSGRLVRLSDLTGPFSNTPSCIYDFRFQGEVFKPSPGRQWKTTEEGMRRLVAAGRVMRSGRMIYYVRYADDFPVSLIDDTWHDIGGSVQSRSDRKVFAVQTGASVVQRCMLMTTQPGDLVFDPTCGSGTTAYVAEQWGRRWITCDVSRVPLSLAKQRLLTATFQWYELKDEGRGPAGGFVYERKQDAKGVETGGIVPHITLESITRDERPTHEVIVDRPEEDNKITRVCGPFCLEATIPTPVDWEGDGLEDSGAGAGETHGTFVARMLEVLRKSPVLRLEGNRTVTLRNIRPPARTLSLSAEAMVDVTAPGQQPTLPDAVQEAIEKNGKSLPFSGNLVAIVFGPENGAVSEKLVYEAAREAHGKSYTHLYVIGFAIQPNARKLVDSCEQAVGVPATYIQATPDLMMGDLLKNMRSSQIFSVCGMPEVEVRRVKTKDGETQYQVELLGLDVFDPTTMENDHRRGDDVPAWFLDTDYNGLCFHVGQAFFPRTGAWESLKKALKGTYDEAVWDHLAGTTSAPFTAGEHGQVAVKVIDDRGNELLVVKDLEEAK